MIVYLDRTKVLPSETEMDTYFSSIRKIARSKPLTIILAITKCDLPWLSNTNRELLTLHFAPKYGISAIVEIATGRSRFNTQNLLRLSMTLEPLTHPGKNLPYLQHYISIPTLCRPPTLTPYLGTPFSEYCKGCYANERTCTSHPCGHFSLCRTCSAMWHGKLCPERGCNKIVTDITEVFADVPITL